MHARGLFMVCGNPDVVVERGEHLALLRRRDRRPLCEASAARCFTPASPMRRSTIWRCKLAQDMRDKPVDSKRVLAIGDSVRTDFTGRCDLRHRLPVRYRRHSLRRIRRTRGSRSGCGRARVDRRRRQAARDCAQADVVNSEWSSPRKRGRPRVFSFAPRSAQQDRGRPRCFPPPPGRAACSEGAAAARASDFPFPE